MESQDEALIETTRDIDSLGELLDYCASLDVCNASAEFWKASLARLFGNILVLQRGDLETAEEWHEFAQLLLEGRNYKYSLGSEGGTYDEVPKSIYAQPKDDTSDVYYETFDVPAMVPAEGTQGYFAQLIVDLDIYEERNSFFCHPNLKKAKERALKWLAENAHQIILKHSHGRLDRAGKPTARITTEYQLFDQVPYAAVPPAEQFVEALLQNEKIIWSVETSGRAAVKTRLELQPNVAPITF